MAVKVLTIKEDILVANDVRAKDNNALLEKKKILMINIMSSPGAGKTTLLLKTIDDMKDKARIGVIEGDVASSVDADKINEQSIPVVQINTAGGCHLDAYMIERAYNDLPQDSIDILFIENVGNLICPAEFALGERKKAMILSLPEGDDKPHKYPLMFTESSALILNKIDLLPYTDFDMEELRKTVTAMNPDIKIFPVSAKTGEGISDLAAWLEGGVPGAVQREFFAQNRRYFALVDLQFATDITEQEYLPAAIGHGEGPWLDAPRLLWRGHADGAAIGSRAVRGAGGGRLGPALPNHGPAHPAGRGRILRSTGDLRPREGAAGDLLHGRHS